MTKLSLANSLKPLLLVPAIASCGDAASPQQASFDSTETQLVVLLDEHDFPYHDVAAADGRLYFAHGPRGVDVVAAGTFELIETLSFTRDREVLTEAESGVASAPGQLRIVAQGVQLDGEDLIVWGVRDDNPPDPWGHGPYEPDKLVVQSLTSDHQLEWRLSLVMPSSMWVPSLDVVVGAQSVHVSVGHSDWGNQLLTFDRPADGSEVYLDLFEGANVLPLADLYPQGLSSVGEALLLSAGRDGLFALQHDGTSNAIGDCEALGYVVDAAVDGERVYVADHQTGIHVVSLADGELRATLVAPDFIHGIALMDDAAYASTTTGVFVTPITP